MINLTKRMPTGEQGIKVLVKKRSARRPRLAARLHAEQPQENQRPGLRPQLLRAGTSRAPWRGLETFSRVESNFFASNCAQN